MMRRVQRRWIAATLVLAGVAAHGQQTPELQRVLKKLGEQAIELEQSLPSFTCDENVVSQEVRDGKVKRGITATMTLRAQKEPHGDLKETFSYTSVNGKPFSQGVVKLPVFVSGGFGTALRYFHPEQQRCYEFALSPGRVEIRTSQDGLAHGCPEKGLVGFARLDASGQVEYLERTVPVEEARPLRLATFAAVTFAPVMMGEKTYRLSSHMVADMSMGKSVGRFEATYANCRLYTSTVTIGPAEVLPEESSASKH